MPDGEVVKSPLEFDTTHLHDTKASPLRALIDCQLFKKHNAMGDRMQLQIVLL